MTNFPNTIKSTTTINPTIFKNLGMIISPFLHPSIHQPYRKRKRKKKRKNKD